MEIGNKKDTELFLVYIMTSNSKSESPTLIFHWMRSVSVTFDNFVGKLENTYLIVTT